MTRSRKWRIGISGSLAILISAGVIWFYPRTPNVALEEATAFLTSDPYDENSVLRRAPWLADKLYGRNHRARSNEENFQILKDFLFRLERNVRNYEDPLCAIELLSYLDVPPRDSVRKWLGQEDVRRKLPILGETAYAAFAWHDEKVSDRYLEEVFNGDRPLHYRLTVAIHNRSKPRISDRMAEFRRQSFFVLAESWEKDRSVPPKVLERFVDSFSLSENFRRDDEWQEIAERVAPVFADRFVNDSYKWGFENRTGEQMIGFLIRAGKFEDALEAIEKSGIEIEDQLGRIFVHLVAYGGYAAAARLLESHWAEVVAEQRAFNVFFSADIESRVEPFLASLEEEPDWLRWFAEYALIKISDAFYEYGKPPVVDHATRISNLAERFDPDDIKDPRMRDAFLAKLGSHPEALPAIGAYLIKPDSGDSPESIAAIEDVGIREERMQLLSARLLVELGKGDAEKWYSALNQIHQMERSNIRSGFMKWLDELFTQAQGEFVNSAGPSENLIEIANAAMKVDGFRITDDLVENYIAFHYSADAHDQFLKHCLEMEEEIWNNFFRRFRYNYNSSLRMAKDRLRGPSRWRMYADFSGEDYQHKPDSLAPKNRRAERDAESRIEGTGGSLKIGEAACRFLIEGEMTHRIDEVANQLTWAPNLKLWRQAFDKKADEVDGAEYKSSASMLYESYMVKKAPWGKSSRTAGRSTRPVWEAIADLASFQQDPRSDFSLDPKTDFGLTERFAFEVRDVNGQIFPQEFLDPIFRDIQERIEEFESLESHSFLIPGFYHMCSVFKTPAILAKFLEAAEDLREKPYGAVSAQFSLAARIRLVAMGHPAPPQKRDPENSWQKEVLGLLADEQTAMTFKLSLAGLLLHFVPEQCEPNTVMAVAEVVSDALESGHLIDNTTLIDLAGSLNRLPGDRTREISLKLIESDRWKAAVQSNLNKSLPLMKTTLVFGQENLVNEIFTEEFIRSCRAPEFLQVLVLQRQFERANLWLDFHAESAWSFRNHAEFETPNASARLNEFLLQVEKPEHQLIAELLLSPSLEEAARKFSRTEFSSPEMEARALYLFSRDWKTIDGVRREMKKRFEETNFEQALPILQKSGPDQIELRIRPLVTYAVAQLKEGESDPFVRLAYGVGRNTHHGIEYDHYFFMNYLAVELNRFLDERLMTFDREGLEAVREGHRAFLIALAARVPEKYTSIDELLFFHQLTAGLLDDLEGFRRWHDENSNRSRSASFRLNKELVEPLYPKTRTGAQSWAIAKVLLDTSTMAELKSGRPKRLTRALDSKLDRFLYYGLLDPEVLIQHGKEMALLWPQGTMATELAEFHAKRKKYETAIKFADLAISQIRSVRDRKNPDSSLLVSDARILISTYQVRLAWALRDSGDSKAIARILEGVKEKSLWYPCNRMFKELNEKLDKQ